MEQKYIAKGEVTFVASFDGCKSKKQEIQEFIQKPYDEDIIKFVTDHYFTFDIYSLMSGEEFLRYVEDGCIMDCDGVIAEVFIDGYKSNLGLCHKGLEQGKFLVDDELWNHICKNHKVEVNWANK